MGLQIEGATGNGFGAKVNSSNQLATAATTVTKEHEINHQDGQAYSLFTSVTPTAGGDCFLYLKNNSATDLIIAELMMYAATTETFQLKLGDEGTPINGNVTTPTNRNAGSGNAADVTALTSEDITGLSGGNLVFGFTNSTGTDSARVVPATGFIIPKNKVLTAYVATGGVAISFGLGLTFHASES